MTYPTLEEAIVIARDALEKLPEVQRVIFGPAPMPPIPADLQDDETTLYIGCKDIVPGSDNWHIMARPRTDLNTAALMDMALITHMDLKVIE